MQEIKKHGFKLLEDCFTDVLLKSPEKRKELHERIADRIKDAVDEKIELGLKGRKNHSAKNKKKDDEEPNYQMVQNWQEQVVGSRGGYAAVRPLSGKNGGGTGAGSVGAITNYLESGHKIRPPGGGKDYRPRINVPYVKGYFFYEAAGVEAERIALEEAERFADELADMLERSP